MSRVLHLVASPRAERSCSLGVAERVTTRLGARRPDTVVDRLDLWGEEAPRFDPAHVGAKMTVIAGEEPTGASRQAWRELEAAFARFDAADTYVVGVPMWNGSIPWVLKRYIDTVTQPGLLFQFDPLTGYRGLLRGKRAVVVYTSAVFAPGVAPAFGRDFQSTYFEDWLRFAGVAEVHSIRFQPTSPRTGGLEGRRSAALVAAEAIADLL